MSASAELLAEVSFFQLLDHEEREGLAKVMETVYAEPDEVIFRFGDRGDTLYLVRSGAIDIFVNDHSGQKISLLKAVAGDVFGELSLLDEGPRTATAQAIEKTELLKLQRADLFQFLRKHPDAALDLLTTLGKRVRTADELLRNRVSRNANEEIEHKFSWAQRGAMFIADFSGSIPFLVINAIFFFSWIILNTNIIPGFEPFDPYPFGFLTMGVSLEAIFLSILVLLAQNLQSAKDRIRGDIEYQVNLKSELEVSYLHEKVDKLNADVLNELHQVRQILGSKGAIK